MAVYVDPVEATGRAARCGAAPPAYSRVVRGSRLRAEPLLRPCRAAAWRRRAAVGTGRAEGAAGGAGATGAAGGAGATGAAGASAAAVTGATEPPSAPGAGMARGRCLGKRGRVAGAGCCWGARGRCARGVASCCVYGRGGCGACTCDSRGLSPPATLRAWPRRVGRSRLSYLFLQA
jgi:hypothetical protein